MAMGTKVRPVEAMQALAAVSMKASERILRKGMATPPLRHIYASDAAS